MREFLDDDFARCAQILTAILDEGNPSETGMFKEFYWTLPLAKFIELYGLGEFEISMNALGEITKRGTSEYAVRAFIRAYPEQSLSVMKGWAQEGSFHLRRLASEGTRPKLPWANKLDLFIDDPAPVFEILEILKHDKIKFVQRSVANNIADYLKVNFSAAKELLLRWSHDANPHTKAIIKHATRKIKFKQIPTKFRILID